MSNQLDAKVVKSLVERIENLNEKIVAEHMAYMGRIGEIKEDIGEVYDEGKNKGIPKRALKLNVKRRELEAKVEALREDLEDQDDIDQYDLVRHALGDLADTEIGQAALRRAETQKKTDGNIDKLGNGPGAKGDPDAGVADDKLKDLRPRNLKTGGDTPEPDKKTH